MRKLIVLLLFISIVSCKKRKFNIITPQSIGIVLFQETFNGFNANVEKNYKTKISKTIHKESIELISLDSSYICFKEKIVPSTQFSLAFWFIPEFYGRNGTIINLSKHPRDFPIRSSLSIFMNKNRIAIMQEGQDLRKLGYKNQAEFTDYFMSLNELNVGEMYFVTYIYEKQKAKLFVDGYLYSEYTNIHPITNFEYVTLGASWNKKGSKFHFKGSMDDIYMFNKALTQEDINNLMDYTHIYQYAK